ncbi:MAG: hypothetical protein Q8K70_03760 [Bacteroidota bacterium]|nr:hypothetical protein [Bacteroidota bacterium]
MKKNALIPHPQPLSKGEGSNLRFHHTEKYGFKKNALNYLILLSLTLFLSCDKDPSKPGYQSKPPKPEYHRVRMSDELKSYIWSNAGSYWIYKNTKTNELDTQTIRGFYFDSILVKGYNSYSSHITVYYDIMIRSFYSTIIKRMYYEYTRSINPNYPLHNLNGNTINRKGNGNINSPFTYPFIIPNENGRGSGTTWGYYIGMDSTLTIQGKTYQNVAKIEIDRDAIWYSSSDPVPLEFKGPRAIYYWAKDVGLVKRETKVENYSWELIKYNIIK